MDDLIGKTFDLLTVIERQSIKGKDGQKRAYYLCECNCKESDKNRAWVRRDALMSGKTKSCGCLQKSSQFAAGDIANREFGFLTALYPTDERSDGHVVWHCRCNRCGSEIDIPYSSLLKGTVNSCGCYRREIAAKNGPDRISKYNKKNIVCGTNIDVISSQRLLKNNTSGYTGVTWDSERSKWKAQIIFQGRKYYLGRFDDINLAIGARKVAEENLFGNFLEWYNANQRKLDSPV